MTQTSVLEPIAAPERTRRLLPIAADLLPVEIVDSRRARKARRSMLAGIAALVVVLSGWYGYAVYQTSVARVGLTGAEADVSRVQKRQDQFAALVRVQTETGTIRGQLSSLMTDDLPWSSLIGPALGDATGGVKIEEITGALVEAAATTPAGAVQLPNTTGHKLVGQLTVKGFAPNKDGVAGYVDALARVPGLGNPYVTDATPHDGVVEFTVQLDVTDSVLGGRFATKNDKK